MNQYQLDTAISQGNENALYLTCAMVDDMASNNQPRSSLRAIQAMNVWGMTDVLKSYDVSGGDTALTDTQLNAVVDNINEYEFAQLLDISDFTYQVGTDADALGGGGTVVYVNGGSVTVPTVHSYTWTVTSNGQTVFTMPFNASVVDTDGISVILNSVLDPQLDVDYTLSGTTFTWISGLYLTAGMYFEIKWSA